MSLYPLSNSRDTKYVTVSNTWARKDTVRSYFTKYTLCIGATWNGTCRTFQFQTWLILFEEDVKDPGRRLQLVWDLHHRLQYGSSLFGIHSNILGSSLLVFLCRALIASFLSRSSLTWLCLQTINFRAAFSLFLGWASNPYHTMYKTLRKLPAQVSWKVKFKCQICPSCLSWVSCPSWWPWWPWRAWLQW